MHLFCGHELDATKRCASSHAIVASQVDRCWDKMSS